MLAFFARTRAQVKRLLGRCSGKKIVQQLSMKINFEIL
jgi:hypothetical protein